MDRVILEKHHHCAVIYLNETETLNAFSKGLKEQLLLSLKEVEQDESIQVVILSAKGKAFCAGGDLKGMAKNHTTLEIKEGMDLAGKIVELIRKMPKVVISSVHGYAAGAGMSLALASDLIIAEEGTKFSLSFKNIGLIPDLGLLYHLPKKIGEWKAKEWIWKGVTIPVEEAYEYGFIYEIAAKNQALEKAIVLAEDLMNGAMQSFIHSKLIINSSSTLSFEEVVQKEAMSQTLLRTTLDHSEGVRSFIEKRKPEFIGK